MYFSNKNSTLATLLGLAAVGARAHMLLAQPPPFTSPSLQNGPIDTASGRPFPCQMKAGETYQGTPTQMPLGSQQDLAFTGGATHGGGSCQISITYDQNPTKQSVWKVIHSIEGGCVANVAGNIGDSATAASPFKFKFPIPSDIPTGKATLAWTWLNRIGNREFYMNCAPVELTGSGGSKAAYDALPDMLVTNVDGKQSCNTVEGSDYKYPNPGKSVQRLGEANRLIQLVCPGAPGGAPGGGSSDPAPNPAPGNGNGGGNGGSQPSKPSPSAPSKPSAPAGGAPSKVPGGVFAPAPTTAPGQGQPTPPATKPSPSAAPKPAPSPGAGSGSGSGSGANPAPAPAAPAAGAQAAGSACQPEGQWNCVGGKSYQVCASGTWSVVMSLAAGTSCTPGQGSTLNIAAIGRRVAAFRA